MVVAGAVFEGITRGVQLISSLSWPQLVLGTLGLSAFVYGEKWYNRPPLPFQEAIDAFINDRSKTDELTHSIKNLYLTREDSFALAEQLLLITIPDQPASEAEPFIQIIYSLYSKIPESDTNYSMAQLQMASLADGLLKQLKTKNECRKTKLIHLLNAGEESTAWRMVKDWAGLPFENDTQPTPKDEPTMVLYLAERLRQSQSAKSFSHLPALDASEKETVEPSRSPTMTI